MNLGAVAAAVLMAVLVAGCSSDEPPTTLPTLSATPPSPSDAAPSPPPAPNEATPQGAADFARHYVDLITVAFADADASSLRAASDPGCGGCRNFIGAVEKAKASEERVLGGEFSVVFAESPPLEGNEVVVDLRYARAPGEVVTTAGEDRRPIAERDPVDLQIRLRHLGDQWIVLGLRSVDSP